MAVPAAAIEGPIAGTPILVSTFFPLAPLGYEQAEYFVSGTASAYTNVNDWYSDGTLAGGRRASRLTTKPASS